MIFLLISSMILGGLIVFSSRSPYYGIFGVLLQALSFSGFLCLLGLPMFGLLVVLIYIGGMLIIFLFSTVLGAERYPDSGWTETLIFWVILSGLSFPVVDYQQIKMSGFSNLALSVEAGLGEVFNLFWVLTILVVFVLLVALMVVLALGYEQAEGSLRKL